MKKKLQNFLILFVIALGVTMSSDSVKAQCNHPFVGFENEHPIDTSRFIKKKSSIDEQNKAFRVRFKYTDYYESFDTLPEVINMFAMVELYNFVISKEGSACTDSACIAGLKITYGLDKNRVKYFYQPIYVKKKQAAKIGWKIEYQMVNFEPTEFYEYKSQSDSMGHFVKTDTTGFVSRYVKNVRIKHFKGGFYEPMVIKRREGSWRNDSKAMIVSFQEIFKLYHLVYDFKPGNVDYCRNIVIHNGAANYRRRQWNVSQRQRAKHTLFITKEGAKSSVQGGYEKSEPIAILGALSGTSTKGGNLGHLCPPSCSNLTYPILY